VSGLCGIAACDDRPIASDALSAMLEAAPYRGRDRIGAWQAGGIALGHLAAALTPTDRSEHQPLVGSGLAVSTDARIDNRADLVERLGGAHVFGTAQPGTGALLLAAYRTWGTACPDHLLGDFAFALWDGTARRLLLACDPMALRTLYYRQTPTHLIFASEIGQLLAHPDISADLDETMVAARLAGLPGAPGQSFYSGIRQLPRGHALEYAGGQVRLRPIWQADPGVRRRYRDPEDYVAEFRDLFTEAVRCRLDSDYPAGLFLSGGVDSCAVAATAGWLAQTGQTPDAARPLRTYSFAFDRLTECDERAVSRHITDAYGLPATPVGADANHPLADYPAHPPNRDAPPMVIYQAVSEQAYALARADGVRTMMSGLRGDLVAGWHFDATSLAMAGLWGELFGFLDRLAGSRRRLPRVALRELVVPAFLRRWPPGLWPEARADLWRRVLEEPRRVRPPDWMDPAFVARTGIEAMLPPVAPPYDARDAAWCRRHDLIFNPVHESILADEAVSHAQFGLQKADAWSDRRLTEFVLSIPQAELQTPSEPKRLARRAMAGIVPRAAFDAMGKVSLQPLADYALQTGARKTIDGLLGEDAQIVRRGYASGPALQRMLKAVHDGRTSSGALWRILNVEIWLRRYWS
jgi:asparagine synthase (glutamine-hydrolysing)